MIRIRVKHTGFREGQRMFRRAASSYDQRVKKALQEFGDEAANWLKERAYAGMFGPAKRRGKGPPLVKTGVYIGSIQAEMGSGTNIEIKPTGSNAHMSNEALGEMLEYGWPGSPARPHWRLLALWVDKEGVGKLGERIVKELLT